MPVRRPDWNPPQEREQKIHVDLHIHHHGDPGGGGLGEIKTMLQTILNKEVQQMAIGQDILAAVTAQTTLIGSVKALIDGLVANGTIPQADADAIKAQLAGNTTALEAALAAGVVIPPVA